MDHFQSLRGENINVHLKNSVMFEKDTITICMIRILKSLGYK